MRSKRAGRRSRGRAAALLLTALAGCTSARGASSPESPLPVPGSDDPAAGDRTDESGTSGAGAHDARGGESPGATSGIALTGGCGTAPADLLPKYVLPFPAGDAYPLSQANCGAVSHEGRFAYAFDFRMPMDTPVIAARDGVVLAVRAHGPDGTRRVGDENYVFIEHTDGEISRYIHLTTEGVLVERGQRVARGDTIALSGNSGRSSFPHLHFDVARGCGSGRCETVWAAFLNATPPIPTELRSYRAAAGARRR